MAKKKETKEEINARVTEELNIAFDPKKTIENLKNADLEKSEEKLKRYYDSLTPATRNCFVGEPLIFR